jgi:hypothetical protein
MMMEADVWQKCVIDGIQLRISDACGESISNVCPAIPVRIIMTMCGECGNKGCTVRKKGGIIIQMSNSCNAWCRVNFNCDPHMNHDSV